MPVVPTSGGPSVGPAPFRPPQTSIDTFGGGTAGTPIDNSGLARAAANIYRDEKQKADESMLVNAGGELTQFEVDRLHNPQNGALNQHGQNAFGLPDEVRADYEKKTADIESRLTNDNQKIAFRRLATSHWASVDQQVQQHVANL